jgi:hypothetical protein
VNNFAPADYNHYNKMLCKQNKLFNTVYGLATVSSEAQTGGIGLGYMIHKNWGGYVEIDNGRNTYDILACSPGVVKELTKHSTLRLGLVLGPYPFAINIGGGISVKKVSLIYGFHLGMDDIFEFDYDFYGVSLGLGSNF